MSLFAIGSLCGLSGDHAAVASGTTRHLGPCLLPLHFAFGVAVARPGELFARPRP